MIAGALAVFIMGYAMWGGDDFTDRAAVPEKWDVILGIALGLAYEGADEFLATREYAHVMRWAERIGERPAVQRGQMVNKLWDEPATQLHERHDSSDFELRTQDKQALEPGPGPQDLR